MTANVTTKRRTSNQEKILDAASREFADNGFAGARVDEIARRAGINKAMLYYHFGDKQALYREVLIRNFSRIERALEKHLANEGSVQERLLSVIATVTQAVKSNPDHPRIVLREFASGGANLPPEVLERMLGLLSIVRDLLVEGSRDGEFRYTDPVMTHLSFIGATLLLTAVEPLRDRVTELGPDIEFPDADADVARFLGDLLLNGIAAPRSGETT